MSIEYYPREGLFRHLAQHITAPIQQGIFLIIGQRHLGKSTFLQQCHDEFHRDILLCKIAFDETTLLESTVQLYDYILERMISVYLEANFSIQRLPERPEDTTQLRQWVYDDLLPAYFSIIRSQRQVVWLFDDSQYLLDAVRDKRIDAQIFDTWQDLIERHHQLSIVMALDTTHEIVLDNYPALVQYSNQHRLAPFDEDDVLQWCATIGMDDPALQSELWQLTGGHPRWCGAYIEGYRKGFAFSEYDDVVYTLCTEDLHNAWTALNTEERLVLQAMPGTTYNDPLIPITAQRLHTWLANSDTSLDLTTIHATLRSLEYQYWVLPMTNGIRLRSKLAQRWLITHSQKQVFTPHVKHISSLSDLPALHTWHWRDILGHRNAMIAVAIMCLTLLLALLLLLQPAPIIVVNDAVATVTLVPSP